MRKHTRFASCYSFIALFLVLSLGSICSAQSETELFKGESISISGKKGEVAYYFVSVPADAKNLEIKMNGGKGDGDLYTKFGSKPSVTTKDWDCRPYLGGNNEICSFPQTQTGNYYIAIHGYANYSNVALVAVYETGNNPTPSDELVNGVGIKVNVTQKKWKFLSFKVPDGQDMLLFKTGAGTGDADLYIQKDVHPSENSFLTKSARSSNNEICSVNNPSAGTYYVGIYAYGYKDIKGMTVKAEYIPQNTYPGNIVKMENGGSVQLSGKKGEWRLYTIEIPGGIYELNIKGMDGSGDADYLVRYKEKPTFNEKTGCATGPSSNDAMLISRPGNYSPDALWVGTYYIGVYGSENFSNVTMTVDFK